MKELALFVLPSSTAGQQGPVASWMSTAGWAAAARRVLGDAWIVTPAGRVEPEAARARGSDPALRPVASTSWRRRLPAPVKTAVKDVRQWRRGRDFRLDASSFDAPGLRFVWQRHEMFQTAGLDLAEALGVPSVLFVPATHVWEATQWGTRRPGWARLAERQGESPSLRRASIVCAGTELVAEQVERLGTPPARVLITPTGVDLDLFADLPDPARLRSALGLDGRFVLGWVGSFRGFHALEQLVDVARAFPDLTLLFVGDGPERPRIEALARDRGVPAVFTGTVAHADLPEHLAAMDVAAVVAGADEVFHYSPLKLAEYLAAGRAVIAPAVPQLADRLVDGEDAVLVTPGDAAALQGAIRRLHDDPALRARLGASARRTARERWSWDHAIRRILDRLESGARPSGN